MKHLWRDLNGVELQVCELCGSMEGGTTTDCPGTMMDRDLTELVYRGFVDFRNGKWCNQPAIGMSHVYGTERNPFVELSCDDLRKLADIYIAGTSAVSTPNAATMGELGNKASRWRGTEWIDVKERLPEKGEWIAVLNSTGGVTDMLFPGGSKFPGDTADCPIVGWIPLPKTGSRMKFPPDEEAEPVQGIYHKYIVRRIDGTDAPGEQFSGAVMSDKTCKKCRFWRQWDNGRGESFTYCDRIDEGEGIARLQISAADDQGLSVYLETGPDFGCNLFEENHGPDQSRTE